MKLAASHDMAEVLDVRLRERAVREARQRGMSEKDIAEAVRRVQMSRASLAMQASPIAFKPLPKPSNPNDPTSEWQRKAGKTITSESVGKGEVVPVKRYRTRHVVEQHGDKLGLSMRSAIEQFMTDSVYHTRIAVCDPNRGGGFSPPSSKLGGLGNVPQAVRDRHARHEWVWKRLSPEMQRTAFSLVTREMTKPDGTPFSLEDFGAQMFPTVADKNRRWGAGAGALWSLCSELVFLYGRCTVKVAPVDIDERVIGGGRS